MPGGASSPSPLLISVSNSDKRKGFVSVEAHAGDLSCTPMRIKEFSVFGRYVCLFVSGRGRGEGIKDLRKRCLGKNCEKVKEVI